MSSVAPSRRAWTTVGLASAIVVIAAPYAGIVRGGFAWDDWSLIVESPSVHEFRPAAWFLGTFWGGGHTAFYRPLVTLTFAVDWLLSRGDASWFHATNIALHLGAATLVFGLSRLLGARTAAATCATILFGVLPRLTESVCWISGRTDLLATMLALAAVAVHWRGGERVRDRLATAVLLLASMLAKEVGFAAVVAVLVSEALDTSRARPYLARSAPALASLAAYFLLRLAATGARAPSGSADQVASLGDRPRIVLQSIGRYSWMFLDPLRPRLLIGTPEAVDQAAVATGSVVTVLLIVAVAAAWHSSVFRSVMPILAMGASAVAMVLDTSVLHLPAAAADRFLYMPAATLAIAGAVAAERLSPHFRRVLAAACVIAAIAFALRARERVADWSDEVQLWTVTTHQMPRSGVAEHELALALQRSKDFDGAAEHFARAAARVQGAYRAASLRNRATALADAGRVEEAVVQLRSVIATSPPTALDHLNMALFEIRRQAFERAEHELDAALVMSPGLAVVQEAQRSLPVLRDRWLALPAERAGEPARISAERARLFEAMGNTPRSLDAWRHVAMSDDAAVEDLVSVVRALGLAGDVAAARAALARAWALGLPADVGNVMQMSLDSVVAQRSGTGNATHATGEGAPRD